MLAVVDLQVLGKLVLASLAGGLGISLTFALAIYGATRALDLRRDGHLVAASVLGLMAFLALGIVLAGAVLGITIITSKD